MSAWSIVEEVIHRWVRESSGITGANVYWPNRGKPRPEPPSVTLTAISGRDWTRSAMGEKRSAQTVSWSVTVDAGPGTHTIELFVVGTLAAVATASVTLPGGTSVEDATTALLAEATAQFVDATVASLSGTSFSVTGTTALPRFHAVCSSDLTPLPLAGPQRVLRVTAAETVISLEIRSSVVAGDGTARLLADDIKDGMRDFDSALARAGMRFGAILRDTPSYTDDLTESRHVIDLQLLGHRVKTRAPKPWVRTIQSVLTTATTTSTVLIPE